MAGFDDVDFYTDEALHQDPYPYFEHLLQCPVRVEPIYGSVAVSGYEAVASVYRDHDSYSSCNSVVGPFSGWAIDPTDPDITAQIEANRHQLPMGEHIVTMDPPMHHDHRGLLMRLLTPRRLKENEDFMWRLADRQIDEFIADGACELMRSYAQPFSLLVIADLLGVPESEHEMLLSRMGLGSPDAPGAMGGQDAAVAGNPLEYIEESFRDYVEQRRRQPTQDVLTSLATATFPDGRTPEVADVARIAALLFAAGQETTARLITTAVRILGDHADMQQELRDDRSLIPNFVEECLRFESPIKSDFRMAKCPARIGDVDVLAGTTVMLVNGAANRDPRRFDDPEVFDMRRANASSHMAFGRGIHSCPGGPLARIEAKVTIERLLDRMSDIRIDESAHGPADARRYMYDPTFILRGLTSLNIEFDATAN